VDIVATAEDIKTFRQIHQLSFEGFVHAGFFGKILPCFIGIRKLRVSIDRMSYVPWYKDDDLVNSYPWQPTCWADWWVPNLLLGVLDALPEDMTTHLSVRLRSLVELELSGVEIDELDLCLSVKHFQRNQNMILKIQDCSTPGGESIPSRMEDLVSQFASYAFNDEPSRASWSSLVGYIVRETA